ncbi:MAG: T9SS type A sorting domain-containing protein [Candidatus Cloacimonetes bacterium]|nr:T9SS type A sorting domain-containing protein [Candidatus Cloacimonadota bacterium]
MKHLILILAVSLLFTANIYAQQWRMDDFAEMQYDENGFLQDIPDSQLYETDTTKLHNNSTNSHGLRERTEPEILWHYTDLPSDWSQCDEVYYEPGNNTVLTVGTQDNESLTFIEFNAANGDVNYTKNIYQTTSGHFPRQTYDMVIDEEENVVITGRSYYPGSSQNVMVIKFDRTTQDTIWTRHFAGDFSLPVADWGFGVTTDNDNNVIVVSLIQRYYQGFPHQFCGIYKLNSDGDLLWLKEVGERFGSGRNVETDDLGNIYVQGEFIEEVGVEENSVIKLDSDGNIIWTNGTSSLYNNPLWAWNLTMNSSDELFVGGLSRPAGSTTGKDFAVAQIDTQDGEFLWVSTTVNGLIDSTDICKYLVYDDASDAIFGGGFVSNETLSNGSLSVDFCIARFDAADGTLDWVYEFDGDPNDTYGNDWLNDMVFDPSGYVIATGETHNAVQSYTVPPPIFPTMQDWITVKLDAETGDVYWRSLIDEEFENFPGAIGPQWGNSVDINPSTEEVFAGGRMMYHDTINNTILEEYSVIGFGDSGVGISENLPQGAIQMIKNYPNPFNPTTTISFSLTTENTESTELIIYNLKGQKVKTLVNEEMDAGIHQIVWNGDDENNKPVSSGIYFYKLKSGVYTSTKKMILMK